MDRELQSLIHRMQEAVSNPDEKPLWLHWSDVFLLARIQEELRHSQDKLQKVTQAVLSNPAPKDPT